MRVFFSSLGAALIAALLLPAVGMRAQETPYVPSKENLAARKWFQDARFGLFIHWGVYSVLGKGEWVMNNDHMSKTEYEKLPPQFNPVKFDPAQWVALAKAAGMKYITITSKHHDGFAMWNTQQNSWNIVDATPYGKDVLKALAEECRKQDIKLFFYHSHLDWYQNEYFPRGRTGQYSGRPDYGNFDKYLNYMDRQLTELLTDYGPIAGIWFDGIWDRRDANWRLRRTYDLIHKLQPAALVGNNHHLKPFAGEDFQMFEKDLPGENTTGFSGDSEVGNLPLETCDTINGAWGYNSSDKRFKSTKDLIHYLARAAGHNANFLLNVGPKPDGTIQDEFVERLREMGAWLSKYGESIYGTRGYAKVPPRNWGAVTEKGDTIYVHVLDWQDEVLALPKLANVKNARLLLDGSPVKVEQPADATLLYLPLGKRDPYDTVVALSTK
ncbi:MAG: alpha-L-fucosidase [Bryobacterales bacterium]|nr:alpha-L-fucosidase [Bryobacterales bacterium]